MGALVVERGARVVFAVASVIAVACNTIAGIKDVGPAAENAAGEVGEAATGGLSNVGGGVGGGAMKLGG
ncbi:MAG TPA: hypothetical protein VNN72_29395, partial [Polyangiaceae bacterium]|nr:hypothetical protein [Polyangiaceae bacterium]